MKSLIDKIKSFIDKTDKKILMGIGAGAVCLIAVIIIIIVAVAGSGDKNNEDNSTTAEKTTAESSTKDLESQKETTTKKDEETTDDTQETGSEEDSSDVTTESGSEDNSNNQTTTKPIETTTNPSSGNNTEPTTTHNTEQPTTPAASSGGEDGTTYLEFPDDNLSLTTVEIAAGKTVHYDVYRVGGMIMKINSGDAYVIYKGKTYKPQNGVVKIKLEQKLASDYVSFDIGNSSSSKQSFKLQFEQIKGTYGDPEHLTSIAGSHDAYLEEGNEQGYFYSYTAEKTGTIVFYISDISSSSNDAVAGLSVTNNNTSANRTIGADGVDDGQGHRKIEIRVTKGDELRIVVSSFSEEEYGVYPEATVKWFSEYK